MNKGKLTIGNSGLHKTRDMRLEAEERRKLVYHDYGRGSYPNRVNEWSMTEIVDIIKRNEKTIDQICGCHTLYIDDIGKEPKMFGEEIFPQIIMKFYDNRFKHKHVPLEFHGTTNMTVEEMLERYGQHTVDRLMEICDFEIRKGKSVRTENLRVIEKN
jgi:hypothetical protein